MQVRAKNGWISPLSGRFLQPKMRLVHATRYGTDPRTVGCLQPDGSRSRDADLKRCRFVGGSDAALHCTNSTTAVGRANAASIGVRAGQNLQHERERDDCLVQRAGTPCPSVRDVTRLESLLL